MFGITLRGPPRPAPHPDVGDVRRGLSRCGRISRCAAASAAPSRLRQALGANPEAHYSMEELVDRRGVRRAARRHAGAPRRGRAREGAADGQQAHASRSSSATPGLDARAATSRSVPLGRAGRRAAERRTPSLARRAHAHQHRPAAPGHARRAAAGGRARRRDGRARASRTSATCTAGSRRSASTASTTRSSRWTDRDDYLSPIGEQRRLRARRPSG